ncbi:MAG: PEP-CTERM sorting domain-containing protein [Planctomycetes bacterium]|nr:PEP-CTERM sorting domain-containing protein [Planctomycetota bacterium]
MSPRARRRSSKFAVCPLHPRSLGVGVARSAGSTGRSVVSVRGFSIDIGSRVAAVPEPSTYAMLSTALACGGWRMLRRRRKTWRR